MRNKDNNISMVCQWKAKMLKTQKLSILVVLNRFFCIFLEKTIYFTYKK
ncbi:hypothetical protein FM107_06975 [Sphingobacterium sp. JB170]|nr:hypothetical protein FM107_06975 [Sphingobacterium sp. JB170]